MTGMGPVCKPGSVDPAHLFACYNCSAVRDSLWIVSYVVDVSAIDECLCCVECLVRNFSDPAFSREHKISLRCGGDGCALKLDTWTKSPELVISFLKEHTEKCPFRPIFCPRGCKVVIRRQDQSFHEADCMIKSTPEEREALKMEELEKRLILPPVKMRYQKMADVPLKRRDSWNSSSTPETPHETLRREALNVSRRGSAAVLTSEESLSFSDDKLKETPSFLRKSSLVSPSWSRPETPGVNGRLSDETLEQLEKARIALEQQQLDVVDGYSFLPEVFAQKINSEDMPLRSRVEKLEDVLATTKAQLEKAFVEIRNLRALLASENKLRELHVNKLRDEVELLKGFIYNSTKQQSPDAGCDN
ncbi:uncharacterized protein LOC100908788 [Galendromus occidentalis]|uniref:Uncharacterized protein LOC100908788 n=1 Tax=Galendromus occidentalis TaxID=34638 RepID=A0AAJ6QTT8_9ACAR|nr:uncharacterized protein LOC100908788 [Galendromus occidentalis]